MKWRRRKASIRQTSSRIRAVLLAFVLISGILSAVGLGVSTRPASASPALIQKTGNGASGTATTITATFSNTTTSGDLIVVSYTWASGSTTTATCSDSSGNTYAVAKTQNDVTNGQALGVCYAPVTTAGTSTVTVTFGASVNFRAIGIHEYSGLATSSPVDVTSGNTGTSTANGTDTVTSTTGTTTVGGDLIFGAAMNNGNASGTTIAGSNYVLHQTQTASHANDFSSEDFLQTNPGSVSATETWSVAKAFNAIMVAFKPAGAAPKYATPTFVQQASNSATATATTITATFGASTKLGNFIAVAATFNYTNGSTFVCTDSSGNTYANGPMSQTGTNSQGVGICYAPVTTAGSSTVTVTFPKTSTERGLSIVEYSGIDNQNPFDVSANNSTTSTTSTDAVTTTSATTTRRNALVFGAFENAELTANTMSAGTNYTLRANATFTVAGEFNTEDTVVTNPGSIAATATYSTSGKHYGAVMVAFKAASIATPTFVQQASTNGSGSGTSITATFGSTTKKGDLIVVANTFDQNLTPTCTDSSSNTYSTIVTNYNATITESVSLCSATVTTTGTSTVTVNFGTTVNFRSIIISEYSGVALVSPNDVSTGNNATGTTAANNVTTGSATTTSSGGLIVGAFVNAAQGGTVLAGTSSGDFTIRGSSNTGGGVAGEVTTEDAVLGNAGSVAATETISTGQNYAAAMATFRAAYVGVGADSVYGQSGSYATATTGTTASKFNALNASKVDSVHHRMFVADFGNNRVLVFNLDSSNNYTDDTADYVLGQSSLTATTPATTQSGMSGANGLAYDGVHDRLFVGDYTNNRVLIFDTSSLATGMNASYVLGQSSWTTATATASQTGMSAPEDLDYDSVNNRLYVADKTNNRVLMFSVASPSNGMAATNVLGQSTWTGSGSGVTATGLNGPCGVAIDTSTNFVYVADANGNRTMVYNAAALSNGMSATYALGQASLSAGSTGSTAVGENNPNGVDVHGSYIYVADTSNNRVIGYAKNGGCPVDRGN